MDVDVLVGAGDDPACEGRVAFGGLCCSLVVGPAEGEEGCGAVSSELFFLGDASPVRGQ